MAGRIVCHRVYDGTHMFSGVVEDGGLRHSMGEDFATAEQDIACGGMIHLLSKDSMWNGVLGD